MMLPNVGRYQIVDLEFHKIFLRSFQSLVKLFWSFLTSKDHLSKSQKQLRLQKRFSDLFFCQTMGERTPDGLAIVAEGHQTYENCLFLSNSVGNHFLHCTAKCKCTFVAKYGSGIIHTCVYLQMY